MPTEVHRANIKCVLPLPTQNACAVFLSAADKVFVINVDAYTGSALSMAINQVHKDRPLTHDLMVQIFSGLGVDLDRVLINQVNEMIFYARIFLRQENELGIKVLEVDARPSDSMVLASTTGKPIYVTNDVLEEVEDMTETLERILKEQSEDDPS